MILPEMSPIRPFLETRAGWSKGTGTDLVVFTPKLSQIRFKTLADGLGETLQV